MKARTILLIFTIFSLFIVSSSCEKEEDEDNNEEFVIAEDSDPIAHDYFIWYDTNMRNALYESGPTVFIFMNHNGFVKDSGTFHIEDRTVSFSRKYFNQDNCKYMVIDTFPGQKSMYYIRENDIESGMILQTKVLNGGARFPTWRCWNNGSTVNNSPIEVIDNQVSVAGLCSFSVNDPNVFGPPSLASLLSESINNPPPRPTQEEINALSCNEYLSYCFISRMITFHINKRSTWQDTDGNHYEYLRTYSFCFSHSWVYECPDGPLERKMDCSVTTSTIYSINGSTQYSIEKEANHNHTY